MKKCPKPLGYGIRRTPVVLGLSAALCMPAAFSYANVDNGMDRESVLSVMQGKTIKGQILDETGESMIGVSVLVKGTTIGTVTDFDGNYTLEVPSGKNILEISYIGYKTKEITIIIRKSKFPQNPKRSVRFSGKRTKRSVQKRKARNTQKAETKVL